MGTAKEAFASRLVEAMLEAGCRSSRNAKSGVDVGPLAKAARVTREMARRYTEGTAVPGLNKMKLIADWLGVRLPWLRDGEGEKRTAGQTAQQNLPQHDLSNAKRWNSRAPGHGLPPIRGS